MTDLIQKPLSWYLFLKEQGAYFDNCISTQDSIFFHSQSNLDLDFQDNFIIPLTDLGLISFSGQDAISFLHNQLTKDIMKFDYTTVKLGGYCNSKGRLLASVLIWKNTDHIVLQLPRVLQSIIQKRLYVFILRAKVKIIDINNKLISLGFIGNNTSTVLKKWFPILPSQPYSKVDNSQGTLIRVANSCGAHRYQWILDSERAISVWPILTQTLTRMSTNIWRLSNIYAGIPTINEATQEQFVPQMINFELIGGIDFKKGCYPGQEIIARSQYLGKIKRRTILACINAEKVSSGMEVFLSKDSIQPCGKIVNAELTSVKNWVCLVEIKLLAINSDDSIHLSASNGPLLKLHSLPYNFI